MTRSKGVFGGLGVRSGFCGGWEKVGGVDKNAALLLSGVVAGRSEERERERERERTRAHACVCDQRTGKGRKACQKRVIGQCGILQPTLPSLCCRGVVPSKADPKASHMAESVTATGSAGA